MNLPYALDRTVGIEASPETVFRFFTDSARWAAWWGAGSSIEARPGGAMKIRYPNGIEAAGEVVEVTAPERIAFTFGYASGQPIAPGASLVTIALRAAGGGTELTVTHAFAEAGARDAHVQGWRFQLSLFANAVADELHSNAAEIADGWYAAWNMAAAAQRFMPGMRLEGRGAVRQCLGTALAEWAAVAADGAERMSGTSVFRLAADGRIADAVSIAR